MYMRIAKILKMSACFGKIQFKVGNFNGFSHRIDAFQKSSFMINLKFSFSTIHSPPDNFYVTLCAGDSAQVCESQGEEFSCPTAEASTNLTCDRTRCPLQGPPMAPVMESQLSTG